MSDLATAISPPPSSPGDTHPTTTEEPTAAPATTGSNTATIASAIQAAGGASLYVGELDTTVTESMLYEIFSMVGPVASIRVCRDAITRRSLGYGYVNYLNAADGERAIEHLNYSLIKNRPCRIMWSQRDPAHRKTGQGNVFIKNLDESIDNKALHDTFAAFGDILSCKVGTDEVGNSRGFAFVHYSTGEAANAAIQAVNGMLLNDKKVFVGHHVVRRERQSKFEEQRAKFTNIFVKNVNLEATDEDFEGLFTPFGDIVSAVLSKGEDGKSKGFGFVNYVDHEDARRACDTLDDSAFMGQRIFVGRAQKRWERDDELKRSHEAQRMENEAKSAGVNLYVKNLDDEWDDERLLREFDYFGNITSCKVMKDENGASRYFGFVCFTTPDEATRAVQEMNGRMIGTKPLYVGLAQRKDVRRQALESQMAQRNFQRMQYSTNGMAPQGYMGQPMYGYSAMPGYPQPGMMSMRPPMMGYHAGTGMMPMGVRPRYAGMPGMPMPYGMPASQMAYPNAPPQPYPVRPREIVNATYRVPMLYHQQQQQQTYPEAAVLDLPPPARLTATALARAASADQKQMLGESMYPLIYETYPELAGKITGMLLEMDNAELLHLIESPPALAEKVDEALRVLAAWGKAPAGSKLESLANGTGNAVEGGGAEERDTEERDGEEADGEEVDGEEGEETASDEELVQPGKQRKRAESE